jgi:hypothetical protein
MTAIHPEMFTMDLALHEPTETTCHRRGNQPGNRRSPRRFATTSTQPPPPAMPRQRRLRPAFIAIGGAVAILALTSTGCSSSTTPSTTTSAPTSAAVSSANVPAGKEQVCAARDQLKTSVTALTSANLLAAGTTAIKAAVGQVQSDLAAVKKTGQQDYETEVDAMQSAVDQVQTAAGNLGNGDAAQNLQAVGTAIAATGIAAEDLFSKLQTACGS